MKIHGSCYCGSVKFSAVSHTPYPYLRCYCSICRKTTAGGGGYAINIIAQAGTLQVAGEEHVALHQARIEDPDRPGEYRTSTGKRYFCRRCGSALWVADAEWPEWVYPFASAIDTPCPSRPRRFTLCSTLPLRGLRSHRDRASVNSLAIRRKAFSTGTNATAFISLS